MFIGLIKKKKKTKTQIVTKVVSQFILQRFNLQKKKKHLTFVTSYYFMS